MARPFRVLVVSASAGTGHIHAGEALRVALKEFGAEAEHVDVLDLAPRWLRLTYGRGFEIMAARAPRLWKELYLRTDGPADAAPWGGLVHRTLFGALDHTLHQDRWDLVLCTHFLPCQLAAGRPGQPPFALVVTDFTLHRYWAQRRVSRFFVATEPLAADLRGRVPGAKVDATGIPIRPEFARPLARQAARARLRLAADDRVVLVMGGGTGIGVVDAARAAMAADVPGLRIMAVAGRNETARRELDALAAGDPRIRAHGLVDRVEDFMAAADVVLTKPGGLTISEALAVGRPLLLARPIPGHEEGNASEIARLGAALPAPDPRAIRAGLETLLADPDRLARMAHAARQLGRRDAAGAIGRLAAREFLLPRVA